MKVIFTHQIPNINVLVIVAEKDHKHEPYFADNTENDVCFVLELLEDKYRRKETKIIEQPADLPIKIIITKETYFDYLENIVFKANMLSEQDLKLSKEFDLLAFNRGVDLSEDFEDHALNFLTDIPEKDMISVSI